MISRRKLQGGFGSHRRLLGAAVGGCAVAVLALFWLTHPAPNPGSGGVSADSGDETKFPTFSSPAVPAMTSDAANMKLGATTTSQPTDEPTALATPVAVPPVKAGS
jgi:hypothetical protein